ncbi:preprotein translocase subunit YajC [Nocardioides antri]|uniref:Preprotein translocase subunit YajC n=1 Tax=Nocardioides antri TaxID=2607659 RepID=A0A5B1LWL3_9ACTN|nr:preprotein translocase subunit YajC [Nocardioides antri]KAA1424129.1 preprotein translocase subunit YajC [Nocardioides antri]
MSELAPLLWIVAIAVVFWLLLIRPAQRRQKEVAAVQASLAPGETVVLTSGIVGTVTETADAHLMLEIAPGVVIKVARGAVATVLRDDDSDQSDAQVADTTETTGPDVDNEER